MSHVIVSHIGPNDLCLQSGFMYFYAMREAPAFLGSHFAVGERREEQNGGKKERERTKGGSR